MLMALDVPRQLYITGLVSGASLALMSTLMCAKDIINNMQALQLCSRLPHQIRSVRIPVEGAISGLTSPTLKSAAQGRHHIL